MLCNKCCAGFILLFWLTFCLTLYFSFFSSWRHSGWLYAQAWKSKRPLFYYYYFLVCTVTARFSFRASDSFCLWLLDILQTPALNLCCVIVPLSLFSVLLLLLFFKSFFSVVSTRSWYHSSACNHVCLIMFIDFNIKTIKPLAPQSESCLFNWPSVCVSFPTWFL